MLLVEGSFFIKNNKNVTDNDSIKNKKNQDIKFGNVFLEDKLDSGEERPWKEKKLKSLELCGSYKRLGLENKYLNVYQCGNYLEFKKYADGSKKLNNMYSCKGRLCSMCAWRRELKIFSQVSKVIVSINANSKYRFLFLTLTCKNVLSGELVGQLDILFKSFAKMFKRTIVDKAIKGWFRALEVTHDVDKKITNEMYYGCKEKHMKSRKKYYDSLGLKVGDDNPNYDMYHPHFHLILMVNKSYFNNDYISQEKWSSLWKDSLKCDYTPIVYIQPFRSAKGKGVAEVSKYTVKDSDYLVKSDPALTDRTVATLDVALAHRRLVAFGGLLKDEHKRLNLTDVDENADLIHIDEDGEVCEEVNFVIERYQWSVGYSNYIK